MKFLPVSKADINAQRITGIAYVGTLPDAEPVLDSQQEWISIDNLKKAAFDFMESIQENPQKRFNLNHDNKTAFDARLLESFVTDSESEINGETVPPASWVITLKIEDPKIYEQIANGTLTGFSLQGVGYV